MRSFEISEQTEKEVRPSALSEDATSQKFNDDYRVALASRSNSIKLATNDITVVGAQLEVTSSPAPVMTIKTLPRLKPEIPKTPAPKPAVPGGEIPPPEIHGTKPIVFPVPNVHEIAT